MLTLLWLAVIAAGGIVCWLIVQGITDRVLARGQRADHERFWGDGATDDGTWAVALGGDTGRAVDPPASVVPSKASLREIWTRDKAGRRRDPERVAAKPTRRRKRKGNRLHPDAVGGP